MKWYGGGINEKWLLKLNGGIQTFGKGSVFQLLSMHVYCFHTPNSKHELSRQGILGHAHPGKL